MPRTSLIKKSVTTCLVLAVVALGSVTAYAYHDTLNVVINGVRLSPHEIRLLEQQLGVRMQSGHYRFDPRSGQLGLERGTFQGRGEQLYGRNWRNYGWTNPNGGSWGYSNNNTGTNVICDSGGCNFAR